MPLIGTLQGYTLSFETCKIFCKSKLSWLALSVVANGLGGCNCVMQSRHSISWSELTEYPWFNNSVIPLVQAQSVGYSW